jgi:two-component system, chemotaxis family, response regulator WspR
MVPVSRKHAVQSIFETPMPKGAIVVVLVDDQAIVAHAIRLMLAGETDMTFHYCPEPERAVEFAAEKDATVILQDLMMPNENGLTLLGRYRNHPATARIPVVVLSSKEHPLEKSRAFTEGAADYLVKIPDKIELLARVRAHSRSYLSQREGEEAYRALDELRRQLEQSNAALERLSNQDGLTQIANRRHFEEVSTRELRRAARSGSPLSLILMDVDHFKHFNDSRGHLAGDACLRDIAAFLTRNVHRPADLVARYGGEEFVALLPDTPCRGAIHVAGRIRSGLEALKLPHGHPEAGPHVSVSLGLATVIAHAADSVTRVISMADDALYAAKRGGRNRHQIHPESVGAP